MMNDSIRCWYHNNFVNFYGEDKDSILGKLCQNESNDLRTSKQAWKEEISIVKKIVEPYKNEDGRVIFEYNIPRLGKRIDVVLLFRGIIFCLEFKVGKNQICEEDIDQVFDYALDLKYFHKFSYDKVIVPILVLTKYSSSPSEIKIQTSSYDDNVMEPFITGESGLANIFKCVLNKYCHETPVNANWIISPYTPTPTIIEAAKKLYKGHSVEDITRHEADKVSTDKTINYIQKVIDDSKRNNKKSICFVTGVPGAGKTLVGLEIAFNQTHQNHDHQSIKDDGAVYLSGNGPLVAVLTEALARDNVKRCKEEGEQKKLIDAKREVNKSIQMIHRYRDNMLMKLKIPIENGKLEIDPLKAIKQKNSGFAEVEHVVIFDEAQRTWDKERLASYLKKGGTYGNKIKISNFPMSEAAFLIWSLDQREDWATIVCLVGSGQEINTGEGGIREWILALKEKFKNWDIYISKNLIDKEYVEKKDVEGGEGEEWKKWLTNNNAKVTDVNDLHLSISLRSFRTEKLSSFIDAMLNFDINNACKLYLDIKDKYPIVLTRDIAKAKGWLRKKVRGSEKMGFLLTKESARYKPLPIHVLPPGNENIIHWFLADKNDIRVSNYLEDAATEIKVQGLELDYTCILWDADMRVENNKWQYYQFARGTKTKWNKLLGNTKNKQELMKYMLNAYRVLLTRARMGMVICVPYGNSNMIHNKFYVDSTRKPEYYDGTFTYFLNKIGIEELK